MTTSSIYRSSVFFKFPQCRSLTSLASSSSSIIRGNVKRQPGRIPVHSLRIPPATLHRTQLSLFHSTPRAQGAPIVPLLVGFLKVSGSLEFVRTLGRIVLTFVPIVSVKILKTRRILRHVELNHANSPVSEEKKAKLMQKLSKARLVLRVLVIIPFVAFWATIAASLERTPLTGRWRLIILSPEEEEEIAAHLAGPGWYQAVGRILKEEVGEEAQAIPTSDWRYAWVQETLRRIESAIPLLQDESKALDWLNTGPGDSPLPPPAEYPLRPRPRAAEEFKCFVDMMCSKRQTPSSLVTGPPYSLLLVDKPDASNAFSYGFGPNGAGGIVVYSGFLDEVLSPRSPHHQPSSPRTGLSWLTYLFGGTVPPPQPARPGPTDEETTRLAILLAHEVSHLILSHHLESLSSTTVMLPGVLSMVADIVRVFIFPITMVFGPFVNDAVAQLGKVGSIELGKCGEYCTSVKQEIEADVVSARLLAYAGYDAREAVRFWEERQECATECSARGAHDNSHEMLNLSGKTHPVNEVRVDRLKHELVRWETERRAAVYRRKSSLAPSSIVLAAA